MDKKKHPVKKKAVQPELKASRASAVKTEAVGAVFPIGGSGAAAGKLRKQAEKMARKRATDVPGNLVGLSHAETSNLLHELRVHQLELEMQNEELRTAQIRLEESRGQYFELYNEAPVGYFTISEKGIILESNLTGANLLGVTPGDLRSKPFSGFIFKDDRDIYYLHRRKLFEARSPQVWEMRMMKAGALFWAHVEATVVQDDKSGKSVCRATVSDITGRKQADEALQASEEKYRVLFNNEIYAILIFDLETLKLLDVNDTYCRMYGYSREELLSGMTIHDITTEHQVSDAATRQAINDGTIFIPLRYHRKKDGTVFPVEIVGGPYSWRGRKVMFALMHDITDRMQAEEAISNLSAYNRSLIEASIDPLVTIDHTGKIIDANVATEQVTGYSRKDLIGTDFANYFTEPEKAREGYGQVFKDGIVRDYPLEIRHHDGRITAVLYNASVYRDESGKISGVFAAARDITDRKRLQEEQQKVEKLESIGTLAGGIAHNFNNILTMILGNISLAGMEAQDGSELQNSLQQAEKASLRAKDLTLQLLTFSKGGGPVKTLSSLAELLKDTAISALGDSNVKCNFSIPAGLWHAEIDARQVNQVIYNLVLNARQSMPSGGTIELSAENITLSKTQGPGKGMPIKAGDYIRVAITDHGTGIPKENMEKIFDPFFTTKINAHGLGVPTAFSIARQHGGHLSVESKAGSGSAFYLYLPASAPKQDKKEAIQAAGKARILVMDDEVGVRAIAGRMLKHIGYEDVEFAEDGVEAIKLYKAAMKSGSPFGVAILDLTIPRGMGGEWTIKKLLEIDPGVKAIISSGYIDDPVMADYKDYGFSGMIAKPYTVEELRKAVQDAIG